jgi:hypothetical protein
VSEVSDLYLGVSLCTSMTSMLTVGAYLDNDRSSLTGQVDGFFAMLTENVDLTRLFAKE